ncbi:MAG TPA: patatin-like phospholipase family protein, partial [Candidatus Limnocylindrales bacterium]|nr:patatin-like phospholipase family protein [Candidatus Limnocylindrales bacterium]
MNRPRRILSIDGGGIRGLIPAVLLESLEAATGHPTREAFDFVAGTSTGAVLAGGVAAGFSGEQLASLYRRRGPELFRQIPVLGTLRRIATGQLYDVGRLHAMIAEELGDRATWRINDVPSDILITAKALDDGHQWYFVKDRPGFNRART